MDVRCGYSINMLAACQADQCVQDLGTEKRISLSVLGTPEYTSLMVTATENQLTS